ncbi:PREDICTED: E3 ubiquitin-protein ligase RBBP6-like [Tauraco erythrolophus]|uniref:E3 ubiquitin-protein ligase RBBP6-like n=1 Tax=Tauraco erythrolophus TaxID=121530 RepID=UPI0005233B63|nr:PREDICTED: E3 ubiquitin-protein ligase RBBP6-like [Tauraco erythrolophus]
MNLPIHDSSAPMSLAQLIKTANLAEANASEEEKIKAVMIQSCQEYHPIDSMKKPPPSYTCFSCGTPGHYRTDCPTNRDKNVECVPRIKKSTGIPRSFLREVHDPNTKGAMMTNDGKYVIPIINAEAYARGKKEKPSFSLEEPSSSSTCSADPVPEELFCLICKEIMTDAAVIPCCGNSYCDKCIRTALLECEEHMCPMCHQTGVSPDALDANMFLHQAVNNFHNGTGCTNGLHQQIQQQQQQLLLTEESKSPCSSSSYSRSSFTNSQSRSGSSQSQFDSRSFSHSSSCSYPRSPPYPRRGKGKSPTIILGQASCGRPADFRDPSEKARYREREKRYRERYEDFRKGCAVSPQTPHPAKRENCSPDSFGPPGSKRENLLYVQGCREECPGGQSCRNCNRGGNYHEKEKEVQSPLGDGKRNRRKKHRKRRNRDKNEGFPNAVLLEGARNPRDTVTAEDIDVAVPPKKDTTASQEIVDSDHEKSLWMEPPVKKVKEK